MEDNTQKQQDIKEHIINTTISLIENSDGLIENITIRAIAQKANVAVGLINYHFESKKNLIEVCVQRIISHVMATFPKNAEVEGVSAPDDEPESEMASFTARVFDFLLNHPEIAKISILADLTEPNIASNSSVSYRAILKGLPETEDKKSERIRRIKAFMLLSAIHAAFLNRQIGAELLHMNLNNEDDYTDFLRLVTKILNIT
jgi:AcrR family transcriptional regulator